MAPSRASSPISESLIWKGRFMRDNKALANSNQALRHDITSLTTRVVAAEVASKNVILLSDRVSAIEQDEREQEVLRKRLDESTAKRLRDVEEKLVGAYGKIEKAMKKMEELERQLEESAVARDEHLQHTINTLREELAQPRLVELDQKLRIQDEAMTKETKGLHEIISKMAKRIEQLEQRLIAAPEQAVVQNHEIVERLSRLEQMMVKRMEDCATASSLASDQPAIADGMGPPPKVKACQEDPAANGKPATKRRPAPKKAAPKKKPAPRKGPSRHKPQDAVSKVSSAAPTGANSPGKLATEARFMRFEISVAEPQESGEVSSNAATQNAAQDQAPNSTTTANTGRPRASKRRVLPTANAGLRRQRSTRGGHRNSQIVSNVNYDLKATKIFNGLGLPKSTARTSLKRQLSNVREEDEDEEGERRVGETVGNATAQPMKRFKKHNEKAGAEPPEEDKCREDRTLNVAGSEATGDPLMTTSNASPYAILESHMDAAPSVTNNTKAGPVRRPSEGIASAFVDNLVAEVADGAQEKNASLSKPRPAKRAPRYKIRMPILPSSPPKMELLLDVETSQ